MQKQLDLVKEKLQELEDAAYSGALSPRFRKQDLPKAKLLLKRKAVLEEKIIFYDE
jgi:hypothetical protein